MEDAWCGMCVCGMWGCGVECGGMLRCAEGGIVACGICHVAVETCGEEWMLMHLIVHGCMCYAHHVMAGAVLAVVGLYDKGKTFVLNQITNVSASCGIDVCDASISCGVSCHCIRDMYHAHQSNFPSGKKVSTKGLSFKVRQ